MTLRRRLIRHISLTVLGALTIAAGVIVGMNGLRQDFGIALQANSQLRHVYEVGVHVSSARRSLAQGPVGLRAARQEIRAAALLLDHFDQSPGDVGANHATAGWLDGSAQHVARVRAALADAGGQLRALDDGSPGASVQPRQVPAIDQTLAAIATLSAQT